MEIKHTLGPWVYGHTPFYLRMDQQGNPLTIRSPHHTEEIATIWTCHLPTEENACLIAASPETTKLLLDTYGYLLHKMPLVDRNTSAGQYLLASIRSQLAEAYNADPQELEEFAKENYRK